MASTDNAADNEDNTQAAPKAPLSARKKLILLIVTGVLVVLGSIGGTLLLLGVFDGGDDSEETAVAEQSGEPAADSVTVPVKPNPAMYFPIKPAFVVNFPDRGRQRYLQVDITVMTRDPDIFTAIQAHMPLIKNRLVMLMSGAVYEELQTDEGKELLRQKALAALQEIMKQELGKEGVEEVLFTNFVMQ